MEIVVRSGLSSEGLSIYNAPDLVTHGKDQLVDNCRA
jgi:hypothetical protein